MRQPKIMLVCSSGGHLFQLFVLKKWWEQYDRCWVTFNKVDATSLLEGERTYFAYFPTNRNLFNLVRNAWLAIKTIWRERPQVIISSGAGVAIPFFLLGKVFGAKLIFLEVIDRLDSPTLTGKIVAPFCDQFLVQWDEQRKFFPGSEIWGRTL